MDSQHILTLVKSDGVERGLVGEILRCIKAKGYKFEDLKFMQVKEGALRVYYAYPTDKPFFPEIVRYMVRGLVIATIFSGTSVTGSVRALAGATSPAQVVPGSTRGDLARGWGHGNIENLIHTSDSDRNVEKEVSLWFN